MGLEWVSILRVLHKDLINCNKCTRQNVFSSGDWEGWTAWYTLTIFNIMNGIVCFCWVTMRLKIWPQRTKLRAAEELRLGYEHFLLCIRYLLRIMDQASSNRDCYSKKAYRVGLIPWPLTHLTIKNKPKKRLRSLQNNSVISINCAGTNWPGLHMKQIFLGQLQVNH